MQVHAIGSGGGAISGLYADALTVRVCARCGQVLAESGESVWGGAVMISGPPSDAGPHIVTDLEFFVDADVEFRQLCCPGCLTAFVTQVVDVGSPLPLDDLLTTSSGPQPTAPGPGSRPGLG